MRSLLECIDELLESRYRSADLGNIEDPLAETVFILLSRQTRDSIYRNLFANLRKRFPRWLDLLAARLPVIERVLRPAGFQRQRARQLKALLRAVYKDNIDRGVGPGNFPKTDLTLDYLRYMPPGNAERFLVSLPGIGPKSARCVLTYSLNQRRFPVDTHVHRIFTRLELGNPQGRKRDHDPFEALVPRRMRKRLHVNLVHHGRAICRTQQPECSKCVLVSFCAYGLSRIAGREKNKPVALDLFAGVGGMGSGFRHAGYRIALAVEKDRNAAQTYRANNPGVPVVELDVRALGATKIRKVIPGLRQVDIVLAGPPCQGYSVAGRREPQDPRNTLFRHVGRLAQELRACIVVFENVPGLRCVKGMGFLNRVLSSLRARGYSARAYLLRACDYGIPQVRTRYFILARRRSTGGAPSSPSPTHYPPGGKRNPELLRTPTVIQALKGLPKFGPGVEAEWHLRKDGSVLLNGSTMHHSSRVVAKISQIRPGGGPMSYRRLECDLARTLVAGHRALPVHPRLNRTISVREAARLQGFPDTYVFCGPRAEQPLQVANAVPPPLGKIIAVHLYTALRGSG